MNVRSHNRRGYWSRLKWKRGLIFAGMIGLACSAFLIPKADRGILPAEPLKAYCSAESLIHYPAEILFVSGDRAFRFGHTQSNEASRTGSYSCRLSQEHPYGLSYKYLKVWEGESFSASVWRKGGNSSAVLAYGTGSGRSGQSGEVVESNASGWEKLELKVTIGPEDNGKHLDFFCFYGSPDSMPVYFDDLEIIQDPDSYAGKVDWLKYHTKKIRDRLALPIQPVEGLSLKAYLIEENNIRTQIRLSSYFPDSIQILGISNSPMDIPAPPKDDPIWIPPKKEWMRAAGFVLDIPGKGNWLHFTLPDRKEKYAIKIIPYPYPKVNSPRNELLADSNWKTQPFIRQKGDQIILVAGNWKCYNNLVFPANRKVILEPGCSLNMVAGARFVSQSPILAIGSKDNPISLHSQDSTAGGFTVIEAGDTSILQHVIISGFRNLEYKGWSHSGAVCFYESPVKMTNSTIQFNHCEDAVNFFRSPFVIRNCQFDGTYGDGLDVDFSKGSITSCNFHEIGNDAMDICRSEVKIHQCIVNFAGDKGISIGEHSMVEIDTTVVNGATIGIASKDLSECRIKYINLNGCRLGLTAFQKKPEFGPARIWVENYKVSDVREAYKIEQGSSLMIKGKEVLDGDRL